METTPSSTAEKMASKAGEAMEKAREQAQEARHEARKGLHRSAEFIREHPGGSALGALGLGIALAQLPLRFLATGLAGLLLTVLKPAAFLYAGMRLVEDYRTRTHGLGEGGRSQPGQPAPREEPFHQGPRRS